MSIQPSMFAGVRRPAFIIITECPSMTLAEDLRRFPAQPELDPAGQVVPWV